MWRKLWAADKNWESFQVLLCINIYILLIRGTFQFLFHLVSNIGCWWFSLSRWNWWDYVCDTYMKTKDFNFAKKSILIERDSTKFNGNHGQFSTQTNIDIYSICYMQTVRQHFGIQYLRKITSVFLNKTAKTESM